MWILRNGLENTNRAAIPPSSIKWSWMFFPFFLWQKFFCLFQNQPRKSVVSVSAEIQSCSMNSDTNLTFIYLKHKSVLKKKSDLIKLLLLISPSCLHVTIFKLTLSEMARQAHHLLHCNDCILTRHHFLSKAEGINLFTDMSVSLLSCPFHPLFPRSPCNRTTMGIFRSKSLTAMMMPWAMMSHLIMPPKMLTRMACTCKDNARAGIRAHVLILIASYPMMLCIADLPFCPRWWAWRLPSLDAP